MSNEIKKTYAYHKPSAEGIAKIQEIRQAFSDFHTQLEGILTGSRESSLVYTNLETAAMWATKSVVLNDANSEVLP